MVMLVFNVNDRKKLKPYNKLGQRQHKMAQKLYIKYIMLQKQVHCPRHKTIKKPHLNKTEQKFGPIPKVKRVGRWQNGNNTSLI